MKNYEVGYCRPPMHSRFEKGKCPNPKGRGKREPGEMADVIHNVLSEEVEYREGHRIKRLTGKSYEFEGSFQQRSEVMWEALTTC